MLRTQGEGVGVAQLPAGYHAWGRREHDLRQRTCESRARVTEGHSAKIPATRSRTRSLGRPRMCREAALGMRSLSRLSVALVLTWMASVSAPRSSTAEAGAALSAWQCVQRGVRANTLAFVLHTQSPKCMKLRSATSSHVFLAPNHAQRVYPSTPAERVLRPLLPRAAVQYAGWRACVPDCRVTWRPDLMMAVPPGTHASLLSLTLPAVAARGFNTLPTHACV